MTGARVWPLARDCLGLGPTPPSVTPHLKLSARIALVSLALGVLIAVFFAITIRFLGNATA